MLSASIVASAVLLLLAAIAYVREFRRGRGGGPRANRYLVGLLALRLGAIALLFLVLSGVVIRRHWSHPGRVVAVLSDVSRSMTLVGADSTAGRALERMSELLEWKLEQFAFAETTVAGKEMVHWVKGARVPMKDSGPVLSGRRTALGAALATAARHRPGAILLFSDGRDNGTDDPVRTAAGLGIPVYPVGCGPERVSNLALAGLTLPDEIYAGDTARVSLRASWSGTEPVRAEVRLDGRERQLRFDAPGSQDAEFEIVFPRPGFAVLRARAESIPGEVTAADNVIEAVVHVRPGRVRVRYLSDSPGPSSRFVTMALGRLARVSFSHSIAAGRGGSAVFADADVYVLDRVRAGAEWPGWGQLETAVSAGAGLLLICERSLDAGHPAARFVPGGASGLRGPVHPQPQPGYPVDEFGRALERLPPVEPAVALNQPGGFEPWWRASMESRPGDIARSEGDPVIGGTRPFGRGRVLYLGWPVWRWGFTAGDVAGAPDALERLLAQGVRFLSPGAEELVRLVPSRPEFLAEEPVRLDLSVLSTDRRPLVGAAPTVTLRWTKPGAGVLDPGPEPESPDAGPRPEPRDTLLGPFPLVELGSGRYRFERPGLGPGQYQAVAGTPSGEGTCAFVVASRSREEVMLGLDEHLLRELARVSGGMYFHADSLPGPGFELELAPSRHGFEFNPRRSVFVYLLLVLLAGAEWALRRRKGLT